MAKKESKIPKLSPPQDIEESNTSNDENSSQPVEQTEAEMAGQEAIAAFDVPSDEMLELEEALLASTDDTGFGAGSWHPNKKITALWSINQTRNAYAAVSGLGWKKLANNSDSGIVALNMLTSHAKDRNRNVKVRIDNNKIVEIYVW